MSTLLIRLAGPVQTWAGYRVSFTAVGTSPVPTKSGVAGLLGACLGLKDYLTLVDQFDMQVRVDRTNPVIADLQVASAPKAWERPGMDRTESLSTAKMSKVPAQLSGTALPGLSNRDFLPHAEFICALEANDALIEKWMAAFRDPVFMSYLGRRANAPSFPVLLGWTHEDASSALARMPRVPSHDERGPETTAVRVYQVTGDYHRNERALSEVTPPIATRKEQLSWLSSHLKR